MFLFRGVKFDIHAQLHVELSNIKESETLTTPFFI